MTEEQFGKVYDVLVSLGEASENMRYGFISSHIDSKYPCDEWRFIGCLGFGGKYYSGKNKVTCYTEHETPAKLELIKKINLELSLIK